MHAIYFMMLSSGYTILDTNWISRKSSCYASLLDVRFAKYVQESGYWLREMSKVIKWIFGFKAIYFSTVSAREFDFVRRCRKSWLLQQSNWNPFWLLQILFCVNRWAAFNIRRHWRTEMHSAIYHQGKNKFNFNDFASSLSAVFSLLSLTKRSEWKEEKIAN